MIQQTYGPKAAYKLIKGIEKHESEHHSLIDKLKDKIMNPKIIPYQRAESFHDKFMRHLELKRLHNPEAEQLDQIDEVSEKDETSKLNSFRFNDQENFHSGRRELIKQMMINKRRPLSNIRELKLGSSGKILLTEIDQNNLQVIDLIKDGKRLSNTMKLQPKQFNETIKIKQKSINKSIKSKLKSSAEKQILISSFESSSQNNILSDIENIENHSKKNQTQKLSPSIFKTKRLSLKSKTISINRSHKSRGTNKTFINISLKSKSNIKIQNNNDADEDTSYLSSSLNDQISNIVKDIQSSEEACENLNVDFQQQFLDPKKDFDDNILGQRLQSEEAVVLEGVQFQKSEALRERNNLSLIDLREMKSKKEKIQDKSMNNHSQNQSNFMSQDITQMTTPNGGAAQNRFSIPSTARNVKKTLKNVQSQKTLKRDMSGSKIHDESTILKTIEKQKLLTNQQSLKEAKPPAAPSQKNKMKRSGSQFNIINSRRQNLMSIDSEVKVIASGIREVLEEHKQQSALFIKNKLKLVHKKKRELEQKMRKNSQQDRKRQRNTKEMIDSNNIMQASSPYGIQQFSINSFQQNNNRPTSARSNQSTVTSKGKLNQQQNMISQRSSSSQNIRQMTSDKPSEGQVMSGNLMNRFQMYAPRQNSNRKTQKKKEINNSQEFEESPTQDNSFVIAQMSKDESTSSLLLKLQRQNLIKKDQPQYNYEYQIPASQESLIKSQKKIKKQHQTSFDSQDSVKSNPLSVNFKDNIGFNRFLNNNQIQQIPKTIVEQQRKKLNQSRSEAHIEKPNQINKRERDQLFKESTYNEESENEQVYEDNQESDHDSKQNNQQQKALNPKIFTFYHQNSRQEEIDYEE